MYTLEFTTGIKTQIYEYKELSECARQVHYLAKIATHLGITFHWSVFVTDHQGNTNHVPQWRLFDLIVSK